MLNRTLGTTLLVSGTTIGAGMLAMPLTSAGIGFSFTILLLLALWLLLTYSALLFVEVYQTSACDAGIGTLAAQYFGKPGRIVATTVLLVFLYALLAAYITGGGSIMVAFARDLWQLELSPELAVLLFTFVFGMPVVLGTRMVDGVNRLLFVAMVTGLVAVLMTLVPKVSMDNLMAMPIDKALIISASPVFFTAFGFHGSIPSLNRYLWGNVKAMRVSIVAGTALTLFGYVLWQLSTHGVLSQGVFMQVLTEDPTLNGLVEACRRVTGSEAIAMLVQVFSALALVTSFLGVALGLLECIEDLLRHSVGMQAGRALLGLLTFVPPILFALFYPDGFILALGYAGQMFAFYAVVLPVGLVWRARQQHPGLPYRVAGGQVGLVLALALGVFIMFVPLMIRAGWLPTVVG